VRWRDSREQVERLAAAVSPVPVREVPLVAPDRVAAALDAVFGAPG
jgi:hypothetical protein